MGKNVGIYLTLKIEQYDDHESRHKKGILTSSKFNYLA